jgi:outer membrane protein assembly factor BamB
MRYGQVVVVAMAWWVGQLLVAARAADNLDWPRFRGPNGQGIAAPDAKPPVEFSPDKNLRWKTDLPTGVSSPIVAGDRIIVTGVDGNKLITLCLNRRDGTIAWRREAPATSLEKVHAFSSPAAATPTTDGRRVYVYFGSFGLLAYDLDGDGHEAWRAPLTRPNCEWGTASSPIVVGDRVIQVCDGNGVGSYMVAVERDTGKIAWNTPRVLFQAGWSTPVLFPRDAAAQDLIVLGSGRLVAYDPLSGKERWTVVGFPVNPIMTPVIGSDGLLFAAVSGMGDPADRIGEIPDFDTMLKKYDKNNDGRISPDEIPTDAGVYLRKDVPRDAMGNFLSLRWLVQQVAHGKDSVGPLDWKMFEVLSQASGPALFAIRPGASAQGNITDKNLAWKTNKNIPELPTPLFYDGRLYIVRDGGRVACINGKTGEVIFHGRVDAPGQYVASPVTADGRIYLASEPGTITVLKATDTLTPLATNPIGERICATPAIAGDTIYVRTDKRLYAFSQSSN